MMNEGLIEGLLKDGRRNMSDTILLRHASRYTQRELEAISEHKTRASDGLLYLLVPSPTHQAMVTLLTHMVISSSLPEKITFSLPTNCQHHVLGKHSCGTARPRLTDFCVIVVTAHEIFVSLVAKVSFRHETLTELVIEAGELFSEVTSIIYSIAFLVDPKPPFHAHFYVFKRTLQPAIGSWKI